MSASRVVFFGPDRDIRLLYEETTLPEVEEGDILAKIRLATICGSDLHTIDGRRKEAAPSILGHEAVAEVVESRVTSSSDLKPGERITFSIINSCQSCYLCQKNLPQKCIKATKYGHLPVSQDNGFNGCYASHIVLKRGTAVYKIPDHVTDKMAAPINCALATMVNAVGTIPKSLFGVAVVHGAGLLGIYGCILLKELGFTSVYVSDLNQERLLAVPRFGGIPYNPNYSQTLGNLALYYYNMLFPVMSCLQGGTPDPGSVDIVIEVCGSANVIRPSIDLLRPGGHLILIGLVHPNSQLDVTAEQIIRKCLTVTGIHNYKPADLEKAVMFISKTAHKYDYESLVGAEMQLKDIHLAVKVANSQRHIRVALKP